MLTNDGAIAQRLGRVRPGAAASITLKQEVDERSGRRNRRPDGLVWPDAGGIASSLIIDLLHNFPAPRLTTRNRSSQERPESACASPPVFRNRSEEHTSELQSPD